MSTRAGPNRPRRTPQGQRRERCIPAPDRGSAHANAYRVAPGTTSELSLLASHAGTAAARGPACAAEDPRDLRWRPRATPAFHELLQSRTRGLSPPGRAGPPWHGASHLRGFDHFALCAPWPLDQLWSHLRFPWYDGAGCAAPGLFSGVDGRRTGASDAGLRATPSPVVAV